jgi:hypothetical protein
MGRIRTEEPFGRPHPGRKPEGSFTVIEVQDPVAGYGWVLDYVNKVAHRLPLQQITPAPAPPRISSAPEPDTARDGTTTSEPLGMQTMFGVSVVGVKHTTTWPTGSNWGNDRPVTSVSESWRSPQLREVVYSKSSSPNGTESTFTLKDLSTAEPDPSLFRIPADYQIIDEAGSFTMKVSLQN